MVNRAYSGVSDCDAGARGAGVDTDIEWGFEGDGEIVDVVRLRWKCFMPSNVQEGRYVAWEHARKRNQHGVVHGFMFCVRSLLLWEGLAGTHQILSLS